MPYISTPKDVDLLVYPHKATEEDFKAVSEFIKEFKAKAEKKAGKKARKGKKK